MNSRGRRTQRRADERRALKRDRRRIAEMVVPEHIRMLEDLIRGR